jgi:hypothetical protein
MQLRVLDHVAQCALQCKQSIKIKTLKLIIFFSFTETFVKSLVATGGSLCDNVQCDPGDCTNLTQIETPCKMREVSRQTDCVIVIVWFNCSIIITQVAPHVKCPSVVDKHLLIKNYF